MAKAKIESNEPITDPHERRLVKARAAVAHCELQLARALENAGFAEANAAEYRAWADMKVARAAENVARCEADVAYWRDELAAAEKGA